jgi:Transposase IS66 family/IS66 C-terminal element
MSDAEKEDARIRARLASLDAERAALEQRLAVLEYRRETPISVDHLPTQVGNPPTITTTLARMAARQQLSAAIVAELFNLWETELPLISGKSKLAEAIRYATSRRKVLECFLIDGRVEIDSNIVERAIRPQTITRKNALFAGSDGGGRTWATIATLLQTAKMNDVDPLTWLAQTLQRIANRWPISQIEKLMPWNYKA